MSWLRVTIRDTSAIMIPEICPNCLGTPSNCLHKISKSYGGPGLGSLTYTMQWPFCAECSKWFDQQEQFRMRYVKRPAYALALLAGLVAFFVRDSTATSLWMLFAALNLAIFGSLAAFIRQCVSTVPAHWLSKFVPVRVLRCGGGTATLEFKHPIYTKRFVELNESVIKFKMHRLVSALEKWSSRAAKQNGHEQRQ